MNDRIFRLTFQYHLCFQVLNLCILCNYARFIRFYRDSIIFGHAKSKFLKNERSTFQANLTFFVDSNFTDSTCKWSVKLYFVHLMYVLPCITYEKLVIFHFHYKYQKYFQIKKRKNWNGTQSNKHIIAQSKTGYKKITIQCTFCLFSAKQYLIKHLFEIITTRAQLQQQRKNGRITLNPFIYLKPFYFLELGGLLIGVNTVFGSTHFRSGQILLANFSVPFFVKLTCFPLQQYFLPDFHEK